MLRRKKKHVQPLCYLTDLIEAMKGGIKEGALARKFWELLDWHLQSLRGLFVLLFIANIMFNVWIKKKKEGEERVVLPAEVNTLLSDLTWSVFRVCVRLVTNDLHTITSPTLLMAVLINHVQLTNSILNYKERVSLHLCKNLHCHYSALLSSSFSFFFFLLYFLSHITQHQS